MISMLASSPMNIIKDNFDKSVLLAEKPSITLKKLNQLFLKHNNFSMKGIPSLAYILVQLALPHHYQLEQPLFKKS